MIFVISPKIPEQLPNPLVDLLQVDQSGLFLPSRDYYLNKTANEKVRVPQAMVKKIQTF